MDMDFFKNSLKYNAPLTILAVVILYLLKPIFENIEFISKNPIITVVFFLVAINALILITLYSNKMKPKKTDSISPSNIRKNKIIGNKAKSINITATGDISGNEINNNEADGDLNIGQGSKNGKK